LRFWRIVYVLGPNGGGIYTHVYRRVYINTQFILYLT
jgi:hypothetical protein